MESEKTITIFAKRLTELRLESGLTQAQTANRLKIRQQSYCRYEHGQGEPSLETLSLIAKLFSVSCDYLLGLAEY